jgi:oligopeptidase A
MARSPQEVLAFLRDLARRAAALCRARTGRTARTFAARELGLPDLQAWDHAYASEKLKQARYAFSTRR